MNRRRDLLKAGAGSALYFLAGTRTMAQSGPTVSVILKNARITTMDGASPDAQALAISDSRIAAVGTEADVMKLAGPKTQVIDCSGRRVIPGLHDGHTHPIRGGLNYNMELRWDGVPSLADAMNMLREQAKRTPPPQWVRVVGGFTEYQFAEKRLPDESKRLDRATALRLWTSANTWFSNEEGKKGALKAGLLADLAVLSDDYMTVPEEQIKDIVSVLTIVGGNIVHAGGPFAKLGPPLPPPSPDWSPVARYGGYYQRARSKAADVPRFAAAACAVHGASAHAWGANIPASDYTAFWGAFGCSCWMA